MITLWVDVPYASFRKSYARAFAETYPLPPPATIYGMLLSLIGEKFRSSHEGVRLAFAYKRIPNTATTLRKLSRYKYGVAFKQSKLGNAPDFIETLCGIEFLCWIDSSMEPPHRQTLESRIITAIHSPEKVDRYGLLCLGLSDDLVNDVSLCDHVKGKWHRLIPSNTGSMELPIWVDHLGSEKTRWKRYYLEPVADTIKEPPGSDDWEWTDIVTP